MQPLALIRLGKIAVVFGGALLLLIATYAGYQLWLNNRSVDPPSPQMLHGSLDRAVHWLVQNRQTVLDQNNSMLWWFIKESVLVTGDASLQSLFYEYKRRYIDAHPENVWGHLFDPQSRAVVAMHGLEHLPDYNLYFLYGATCSRLLEKESLVQGN